MNIINHPLCTAVIGAPADMQDGSCEGLPVAYDTDQYGTWAVSFWRPEDGELATLNDNGVITLYVRATGRQHPVVGLGVYPEASGTKQPSPKQTMTTADTRADFEAAALAYTIQRRDEGKTLDDNGCPATTEALFWKTPTGDYGVHMFNAAWWGWQAAVKTMEKP